MTKPGYKTTEFWLTLLALAVSVALPLLSAALPATHLALTIVGVVGSVLAALGYTVTRGKVKAPKQLQAEAISTVDLRGFNDNPTAIVADVLPEAPQL